MNQLNKLIQQYGEYKNSPALAISLKSIIQFESEKEGSVWVDFINFILASRPTCGKEQRLFLDEIEKLEYSSVYGLMYKDCVAVDNDVFYADLQKVIQGE